MFAAILLQVGLSSRLTVGPRWLLPALEGVLLIGLAATTPRGSVHEDHPVRRISNGRALILSGIAIWLTNVLIFALWYWQLDRRGPANRARRLDPHTQADSLGQFPTACVALITGGALRISRRDSAAPPC